MKNNASLVHSIFDRYEDQVKKSHYWQAFPASNEILDLKKLDNCFDQFAVQWLNQLTTQPICETEITVQEPYIKPLRHLYFETLSKERLYGNKSLGLGFPFVLLKNPNNPFVPFALPVFIWMQKIEASPNRANTWIFKHYPDLQVVINPFLLDYLKDKVAPDFLKKLEKAPDQRPLSFDFIQQWCSQLAELLELDNEPPEEKIAAFPTARQASILAEKGAIQWSGVLSHFPQISYEVYAFLKEKLIATPSESTPDPEEKPTQKLLKKYHPFGAFIPDPEQQEVLIASHQHQITLVNGPQGSGKTFGLANILTNALSNGLKCIVVSEEMRSLRQIQKQLIENGIDKLSFLLKDLLNDKPLLLEVLRQTIESTKKPSNFSEDEFELLLGQCQRAYKRLEVSFQGINGKIFGNLSWTETVGKFLGSNKIEGKELLSSQLNPNDFVFTFSEYELLKEAILSSKDLFQKVNTLKHPLTALHRNIFINKEKDDAHQYIVEELNYFLENTSNLQYRYINKLDSYTENLTEHYENHYTDLFKKLHEITENIEDYGRQYGADFEESGFISTGKLHVYGVFSNKHKNILQAKEAIAFQFQELQKAYQERKYFDYRFPKTVELKNIKRIRQYLEDFEKTLDHWYQRLPNIVQEEVQRLNNKTVHIDLDFREQIEELEYALDVLVEEFNNANLFEAPLSNNMLTISKRQQFLEDIIEKLEYTQYNLRDFSDFYNWQRNWLQLGDIPQKLIRALVKVKPTDWLAAFESWYFHNRLTLDYQSYIPQNDELLVKFSKIGEELRKLLPKQILHYWHQTFSLSSKALKRTNKEAYSALFSKNNRQTGMPHAIKSLFNLDSPTITDAIPVLLTTPDIAGELFVNTPNPPFDLILFDEADHLTIEKIFPIMDLGKRAIIFGSNLNNRSNQHEETLFDYAVQLGAKQIQLSYIHQPIHPDILQFNKAALYDLPPKLLPAQKGVWNNAFEVRQVDGRYEEENGTNEAEALEIIRLLNQIEETKQHTYPSVLIVCMTVEQRDLIADYLLKIKQQRAAGSDKIRQLERNGLSVIHTSELHGYASDILILSLTYGSIDLLGTLTEDIQFINRHNHEELLTNLLSRYSQKAYICTSIPEKIWKSWTEVEYPINTGKLGRYINYAKAVEDQNFKGQNEALEIIAGQRSGMPLTKRNSLFIEEIAEALRPYFEEGRISLGSRVDQLEIPLLVNPVYPQEPPVIIQADGFFTYSETGSFLWEMYIRNQIEQVGLYYCPTWSVNWWKNPRQEARKLASIIIRQDNKYGGIPTEQDTEEEI